MTSTVLLPILESSVAIKVSPSSNFPNNSSILLSFVVFLEEI